MNNPVPVLIDDEVAEIEASQIKRRESLAFHQAEYPNLPTPPYIAEIDSLCATVRALREKYESLKSKIAWHRDGVGPDVPVLQERYDKLIAERNALRTGLHNIYHVITDEECNAAVALGMATSAVSSLINQNTALREQLARAGEVGLRNAQLIDRIRAWSKCADGYPLDEHINNIATQLAQVTQEQQQCLEVQKRGVHSSTTCPCVIAMEASDEQPQP